MFFPVHLIGGCQMRGHRPFISTAGHSAISKGKYGFIIPQSGQKCANIGVLNWRMIGAKWAEV